MMVVVHNHKDIITVENAAMPLLLIIIKKTNKQTKPEAHVCGFSYNYASSSINSNVSTIFIIASKSTSIPDLLLFLFESSSNTTRV